MHQELEKLINIARESGELTEKQKEIILRKAEKLGEDVDEVEMIIETSLHSAVKKPDIPEVTKKCPNCGARVTDSRISCPECGFVFQKETSGSSNARSAINELEEKLLAIDKEVSSVEQKGMFDYSNIFKEQKIKERKKTLWNTFTVPKTKDGLLQFFDFVYPKYISEDEHSEFKAIYLSKSLEAYRLLTHFADEDPEVARIVEEYAFLKDASNTIAKTHLTNKVPTSKKSKRMGCLLLSALFLIAAIIYSIPVMEKDKKIKQEVLELAAEKEFDAAKTKALLISVDAEREKVIDKVLEMQINDCLMQGKESEILNLLNDIKDPEIKLRIKSKLSDY